MPVMFVDAWLLDPARPAVVILAWAAVSYSVFWIYNVLMTPDSHVSGTPATMLTVAALTGFLLEIISMLTNEKRRALHDFIAGTVVVRSA
jgi:uncharacterized RDD family membrane protein YckC